MDMVSINGNPIVLEINGGRPTASRNPMMFKLAFSPNSKSFVFEKETRSNLLTIDVKTAWSRLNKTIYHNRPLAFNQKTEYGVYPLVWLKGLWAMLIAFSDSPEVSQAILKKAKNLVYIHKN